MEILTKEIPEEIKTKIIDIKPKKQRQRIFYMNI